MTQWGLDTLFNPAKRHMDEEKRRLQATREEAGDSSGGRRIDLESGKVKIKRPGAKASHDTEPASSDPANSDPANSEATASTEPTDDAAVSDPAVDAPET